MSTVTNKIFIFGDANAIFDVITTAKYWTEWHPATVAVSGQIDEPVRVGDVIRERARIAGVEVENDWTVAERESPRRVVLVMPNTRLGDLRITYRFEPKHGGVEFSRELVFDTSAFAPVIAGMLREQMVSDSQIAVQRVKRMVETAAVMNG